MKTFNTFLFESKYVAAKDADGPTGSYTHNTKVMGHHISTEYSSLNSNPKKHFRVDFSVNNAFKKNHLHVEPSQAESGHILKHVESSIGGFVNKKKPTRLEISGNTSEKHNMYGHFTKRFAAKTGGTFTPGSNGNPHVIEYK